MEGLYLLYKVLKDRRADLLLKVNKRWFLTPEEKKEYFRIRKFLSKYGKLPSPPEQAPIGYNDEPLEYYLDVVRARYLLFLVEKLKNSPVKLENVQSVINNFVSEVREAELIVADGVVPASEFPAFVQQVVELTRLNRVSGLYGYPTGYPTIDVITGGIRPGDIFVICARLKKGKTIYLLNILRKLAKQYHCLFISMEMSLSSIVNRIIFLETKLYQAVQPNRIISSFHDEQVRNLNLNITLVNGATLKDVEEVANLITYYEPELVFIDGAYLLPTERVFKSEWERAKYIIETLRRIALLTGKAMVCTYQLNRQATRAKEPKAEHIAFTDAIAQSASVVLAIDDGDSPVEKKFYILANREGESDLNIRVHFDWRNGNFEEITNTSLIEQVEEEWIDEEGAFGEDG